MKTQRRIDYLVKSLHLLPHPEGGFYRETYRSSETLNTEYGSRNLATSIYFLLTSADVSRFHRIKSDELWFFHEGSALTIHLLNDTGHQELRLGLPYENEEQLPYQLVKANTIFGSTIDSQDSYALVSCVVSPGFDFNDFELFDKETLAKKYPEAIQIISRLT
ncbi:cupin domain-containing protein [Algoriphagus aquimarinus]|uniref:Cupin domain-containing protein n=1 Tax=Algoriphagus aquimarinus TaxID=237018 RepID=A0A5C7B2P7_9BACT|nr:cupin domain-containing protein [Algoriphagus aquimarinus]TXE14253.1 cupin domain-containing protein [Algoriphagus aquimarinus]